MVFSPHFVDNQRFAQRATEARASRGEVRARWGISPNAVVMLFAGKFIPLKRPFDFVQAVVLAARRSPQVVGLMVGDGPLRAEIEAAIQQAQAPISLTGFLNQTEIPKAYGVADALAVPSSEESWGLVVNEAMACGLPVVASNQVGCVPDLVVADRTGYVFECGDMETLSSSLIRLAGDPDLRAHLGQAARERVGRYTVQAAADGLCQALARCSGQRLRAV
jgi:glycosyltransferase involved in cell wall biosynthesis